MKDLGIKYSAAECCAPESPKESSLRYPELRLDGEQIDRLDLPTDLTKRLSATIEFEISALSTGKTGWSGKKSMELKVCGMDNIKVVGDAEDIETEDEDDEDTKPIVKSSKKPKNALSVKDSGLLD